MPRSPRTRHAYRHCPAADSRLSARGTEDSRVAPLTAQSCAREFQDRHAVPCPHAVPWWGHRVCPAVERDTTRRGRLQAVLLRVQNRAAGGTPWRTVTLPARRRARRKSLQHEKRRRPRRAD